MSYSTMAFLGYLVIFYSYALKSGKLNASSKFNFDYYYRRSGVVPMFFKEIDTNRDGYLDMNEIDGPHGMSYSYV